MKRESQREFEPKLKSIYDCIKGVSTGSLSALASTNEQAVTTLSSKTSSCITSLTSLAWSDQISSSLSSGASNIDSLLQKCTTPGNSLLGSIASATDSLNSELEQLDATVNETNTIVDDHNSNMDKLDSTPKYVKKTNEEGKVVTTNELTQEYQSLVSTIESQESQLQTKDDEIDQYESACEALVAQLKGLLGPIGSSGDSGAAGPAGSNGDSKPGEVKKWENGDASIIDEKFDKDYTVEGTETYDSDGKLISRTYTVKDKDGNVIRTGTINYDSEGHPTINEYIEDYDKPTASEDISKEAAEGDTTGTTAYFDEDVEDKHEEHKEETKYEKNESTGLTEYESNIEENKTFTDGTETNMKYTEKGVVNPNDPTDLIPEEKKGTGTLKQGDKEYNVETDESWFGVGGHDDQTKITTKEDELVVETDQRTHVEGEQASGIGVKNETEKTTVKEEDKTDTTTIVYTDEWSAGNNKVESKTEITYKGADQEEGTYKRTDASSATPDTNLEYKKDDAGKLHEIGTNNMGQEVDNIVEHDYRVVTTTDAQGHQKTETYDFGTERGREQFYEDVGNSWVESTQGNKDEASTLINLAYDLDELEGEGTLYGDFKINIEKQE